MRGKHLSKTIEELVAEAEGLVRGKRNYAYCSGADLLWIRYL
jgi:hypothetical protein